MTRVEVVEKVRRQAHEYVDMSIAVSDRDWAEVLAAGDQGKAICAVAGDCLSSAAAVARADGGE